MGARVSSGKDSKQDYETPPEFVQAVEYRLAVKFGIDLAGTEQNKKASLVITAEQDSLSVAWNDLKMGPGWLNPPFAKIGPWADKFVIESRLGFKGVMLTPASVDTIWHRDYVYGKARVLFPYPRIQFVGAEDPYPKPLMLSCYGFSPEFFNGEWYQPWCWAKAIKTPDLFG